ncbi:MAG: hypothetical protein HY899_13210, partial [Deltaproteobacteria bacterium]|nr:hypothetical protein [Deltaproteobacteria bacterium]
MRTHARATKVCAAIGAALLSFVLCVAGAAAQALPGAATGSQTGDAGGPYAGLASAPEADLFTGAAQTSIPIQVPPGRLGVAPVLALSYSSSAGPSAYGYGWTLPLARIHRSLRNGVPRYDASDVFVLAMPGASIDLEAVAGSPGNYRPKIESTFPRIAFSATGNLWRVIDKSGVTFTFGSRPTTRLGRGDGLDQTFAWLIERIEDPAGNTIDFFYREDPASGLATALPARIEYGGNSAQSMPSFAEVRFTWQAIAYPSGPAVSMRAGFRELLDARLASIETFTRGVAARRYDFSHEVDPASGDARLVGATLTALAAETSGDVRLPSTVFSYAPALPSGWPTGSSSHDTGKSLVLPGIGPFRLGGKTTTIDTLDLNGDAIPDYVDVHRAPAVVRLGTGKGFSAQRSWRWPAAPKYPQAPQSIRRIDGDDDLESNVFDLDGDGFADLVDSRPLACAAAEGRWCIWRGSADGFAAQAVTWKAPGLRLRDTRKSGTRVVADLVDLNGDGYLDYVDSSAFADGIESGKWKVFWNNGKGFADAPSQFVSPLPYLARWRDGRMAYGIFDLNADALPDLVVAEPGSSDTPARWDFYSSWQVHLGDGRGFASAPALWPIESDTLKLPNFLNLQADDGSVVSDLLDINGDGRPDIVRRNRISDYWRTHIVDTCASRSHCPSSASDETGIAAGFCCYNLLVYINTGSSFAAPTPWTAPANAVRTSYNSCPFSVVECTSGWLFDYDLFDFNGDGLVDLVERAAPADPPTTWRVFLHPATPTGDVHTSPARPNLLLSMMNGIGGQTLLGYQAAAIAPDTHIPFPYWTVVRREIRDGVYDAPPRNAWISYRGGRYDPVDREMRGFAVVQQVDDLGITRVREFHQDTMRKSRLRRMSVLGRPSCQAVDPMDPNDPCSPWRVPLSQQEYVWSDHSPVLLASQSEVPFGAAGAVEALRTTTEYRYDDYGNTVYQRTFTPLAATTTIESEFEVKTTSGAGGLPEHYTVNKPRSLRVTEDGRVAPLLERRFEYDWRGPAFGALSKSMTCAAWNAQSCTSWSARTFVHDPYGNIVSAASPAGETSTTVYEDLAVFPMTARDAARLLTTSEVDPRSGSVTRTVDPAGNRLYSEFDGLGRLLRTWGPGTSRESPLGVSEYAPGALGEGPPRIVTRRAGAAPTATFFDGLGREVATKTLRATDEGTIAEVSGLRRYNADGTVARRALPLRAPGLDVAALDVTFDDAEAWVELLYDEQGRPTQTIYPDSTRTRIDRSAPGIAVSYDANISEIEQQSSVAGRQNDDRARGPSELRSRAPTASRSRGPSDSRSRDLGGAVTIELFDGLGRRVQRDVCSAAPVAPSPYDCPAGTVQKRESWFYDGLGRVVATQVHALGQAAGDALTRIEYDGLGNRSSVWNGDAGTWHFERDLAGRLTVTTRPDGVRIASTYDQGGRLLRHRGPATTLAYRYWNAGPGIGKVRRIGTRTRRARVVRTFTYDVRGRLGEETWMVVVRGETAQRWTARYRYDELNRRVAIEYPTEDPDAAEIVETGFNEYGDAVSLSSSRATYVAGAAYDTYGRLIRIDYGNGLSDRLSYDPWSNARSTNGRLQCLRTTRTDAPGSACEPASDDPEALWYRDYDANGNLLEVADLAHSAAERFYDGRTYAYDAVGRLSQATYGDGTSENFEFDPLGNLLRKGNSQFAYTDPSSPSRLSIVTREGATSATYTTEFDANGSRTRGGDTRYEHDDMLRLTAVSVAGETVTAYGYDDSGHRIYRYDAASDTLRYELGDLVAIQGGNIDRMFHFGDRLVAVDRVSGSRSRAAAAPSQRLFLHPDHQGTPRLVTDGNGNV